MAQSRPSWKTVYRAIDEPMPVLDWNPNIGIRMVEEGQPRTPAKTGKREDLKSRPQKSTNESVQAPVFWFSKAANSWWNSKYNTALLETEGEDEDPAPHPRDEPGMLFDVEGDVVRGGSTYLLHSVNMVLQEILKKFNIAVDVICQTEVTLGDKRMDYVWSFQKLDGDEGLDSDKKKRHKFAVLEYKRVGSLFETDWEVAKKELEEDPENPGVLEDLTQFIRNKHAESGGTKTFFSQNPNKLIRQAGGYAIATNTPYVAIFDWYNFCLLEFEELKREKRPRLDTIDQNVESNGGFVGYYVNNTYLRKDGEDDGTITFRQGLLGFLLTALEYVGKREGVSVNFEIDSMKI